MDSVVVIYDPACRLGNRMFQYAFGRLLAEAKDCPFYARPLPGFINTETTVPREIKTYNPLYMRTKGDQYADWSALLKHQGTVIVNNWVQRLEYYINHIDKLKEWFYVDGSNMQVPGDNDLVIHLRLGDYKEDLNFVGMPFYHKVMEEESYDKCHIVVESENEPEVDELRQSGCNIVCQDIMNDYYFLMCAKKLVISASTFSWWPAFLGNANVVYIPLPSDKFSSISSTHWRRNPSKTDIDIYLKGGKYKYIDMNTFDM